MAESHPCDFCGTGGAALTYRAPGSEKTWLLCSPCAAALEDRDQAAFARR